MSTWSQTNLNTQSPSISNLSAHVDLFLLVRVYVSSPSLPGLSSNMLQGWADLFSGVHGVHIALILCLLPMLRSVDEAPAHVWHVWSSPTRIGRWDPQALATPQHQATPHAYGIRGCSHTNTHNSSFLVISSLFCQAREPPGTLTRWFTSWSGAEHVWQQGP